MVDCRMRHRLPPGAACRCIGAAFPACTAQGDPVVYDADSRAYAYDAAGRPRSYILPPTSLGKKPVV
jgi:hypothetical protein